MATLTLRVYEVVMEHPSLEGWTSEPVKQPDSVTAECGGPEGEE